MTDFETVPKPIKHVQFTGGIESAQEVWNFIYMLERAPRKFERVEEIAANARVIGEYLKFEHGEQTFTVYKDFYLVQEQPRAPFMVYSSDRFRTAYREVKND